MKLTIKMKSPTSFVIVEQDTGEIGYVNEPLYKDNFIYICQRCLPEFTRYGDNIFPCLYLRGSLKECDENVIDCDEYIYRILCTLKKVFDDFTILNCNKFVLEK